MNTKQLLERYKQLDLDLAIIIKEKDLIKTQLRHQLEEEGLDSMSLGEFKVSISEYERVMFIKKSLEQYIDSEILDKCKKVVSITKTLITYEK